MYKFVIVIFLVGTMDGHVKQWQERRGVSTEIGNAVLEEGEYPRWAGERSFTLDVIAEKRRCKFDLGKYNRHEEQRLRKAVFDAMKDYGLTVEDVHSVMSATVEGVAPEWFNRMALSLPHRSVTSIRRYILFHFSERTDEWTISDQQHLELLMEHGASLAGMADELGRSRMFVQKRITATTREDVGSAGSGPVVPLPPEARHAIVQGLLQEVGRHTDPERYVALPAAAVTTVARTANVPPSTVRSAAGTVWFKALLARYLTLDPADIDPTAVPAPRTTITLPVIIGLLEAVVAARCPTLASVPWGRLHPALPRHSAQRVWAGIERAFGPTRHGVTPAAAASIVLRLWRKQPIYLLCSRQWSVDVRSRDAVEAYKTIREANYRVPEYLKAPKMDKKFRKDAKRRMKRFSHGGRLVDLGRTTAARLIELGAVDRRRRHRDSDGEADEGEGEG